MPPSPLAFASTPIVEPSVIHSNVLTVTVLWKHDLSFVSGGDRRGGSEEREGELAIFIYFLNHVLGPSTHSHAAGAVM